jgi:NAD(P)-dependent dehydrogenase (short-subunit alcohol dehydrogenase family)
MDLPGKVAVVTGSGNGIGEAIAKRFAAAGAKVLVTDVEPESVRRVATEIGALGLATDITVESNVQMAAALAEERLGPVDIWHSNAGLSGPRAAGELQDDQLWDAMWRLHVMSHLYAARAVLPSMLERGDGYLLATASSTALSLQVEKLAYSVTKRGALALSEWLAVTFRPKGIKVSCVCPGAVLTRMLTGDLLGPGSPALANARTPEQVAEIVIHGIRDERFLIVTNPGEEEVLSEKAADYDAWIDAKFKSFGEFIGRPDKSPRAPAGDR